MKKLLALSLMMSVVSLTNAGFWLEIDTDGSAVTVNGADNPVLSTFMYLVLSDFDHVGEPVSSFDGYPEVVFHSMMINATGFEHLLGLNPGSVVEAWGFELKDIVEPFIAPNGLLLTADIDGLGSAYLLNNQGTTLDSVHYPVPEPSSLLLIGMGGLSFYVANKQRF